MDVFYWLKKAIAVIPRTRTRRPIVSHDHDVALLRRLSGRRFPRVRQLFQLRRILSPGEKRMLNAGMFILVVGLVWFGIAYSAKYRVAVPRIAGDYTEGVVGTIQSVNPLFAPLNDVDLDLTKLVYSGLMKYDKHQKLIPDLAERFDVSPDKKVYTFYLKPNVTWHDGKSVTAHDVAFTIESLQDPVAGSPLLVSFQGVGIDVVDDQTIRFTLADPFAPFLGSLTVGILPEHVWGTVPPDQLKFAQWNVRPIGTGPFQFKRLLKDDTGFIYQYELERFPGYYDHLAFLKILIFKLYPGYDIVDGAVGAIREQKVDGLSFVPFNVRDKVQRKHIILHTLQLPQYTALFFNQENSNVLESTDVRRALLRALDKEKILKDTLLGAGEVLAGPILPGFPGYETGHPSTYSAPEANRLLDANSKRISADEFRMNLKIRLMEEGLKKYTEEHPSSTPEQPSFSDDEVKAQVEHEVDERLKNELSEAQLFYRMTGKNKDTVLEIHLVTADTPEYHEVAEMIAGYWQEAGVKTSLEFVNAKELPRRVLKGRSYDVLLYGVILGVDPDQYPFWHSSQIDHPGLNLSRYVNRKVDDILQKIRDTDDTNKLSYLYTDLQNQLLNDVPAIFLYTPTYTYAQSDQIHGFDVDRVAHPSDRFANVAEWYTKTETQWTFGKQ